MFTPYPHFSSVRFRFSVYKTKCHVDNSEPRVDNFFERFDKLSHFLFGNGVNFSYL